MARVSPSTSHKPLLSSSAATNKENTKTSKDLHPRDLVKDFNKVAAEARVWSKQPAEQLELAANAGAQMVTRAYLAQSTNDFVNGSLQKILERHKKEMKLVHESLNSDYTSKVEDLKKIHDIEKLTHLSADLDDISLTNIHKNYLIPYLLHRKILADLHHVKTQLLNNKKKMQDFIEVTDLAQSELKDAHDALETSIKTGIKTLKAYKTLSDLNAKQTKAETELKNLIEQRNNKKKLADNTNLDKQNVAFTNILDPDNLDQLTAQKNADEYKKLTQLIDACKEEIQKLELSTRMDNDYDIGPQSIHRFAIVKNNIKDSRGCCTLM